MLSSYYSYSYINRRHILLGFSRIEATIEAVAVASGEMADTVERMEEESMKEVEKRTLQAKANASGAAGRPGTPAASTPSNISLPSPLTPSGW